MKGFIHAYKINLKVLFDSYDLSGKISYFIIKINN
jgi:hypothetical protein